MSSSGRADLESQRLLGAHTVTSDRWTDIAFPEFSFRKSIVWITLAQLGMYIVSCLVSGSYLEPNTQALMQLGGAYAPAVRDLQLWRVVTPVFLHANLLHLAFNLLFILHVGLRMEAKYGMKRFVAIYFFSALVGNLLSMLMHPCALSVGASTAGFGIIGGMVTEILLVWDKLSDNVKGLYAADTLVFVVFVLLLSFGRSVDVYGHLGGFIGGVAMVCAYNKDLPDLPPWHRNLLYAAAGLCLFVCLASPLRIFFGIPYELGCQPR